MLQCAPLRPGLIQCVSFHVFVLPASSTDEPSPQSLFSGESENINSLYLHIPTRNGLLPAIQMTRQLRVPQVARSCLYFFNHLRHPLQSWLTDVCIPANTKIYFGSINVAVKSPDGETRLFPRSAQRRLSKLEKAPTTPCGAEAVHTCKTICVDVAAEHLKLKPRGSRAGVCPLWLSWQ